MRSNANLGPFSHRLSCGDCQSCHYRAWLGSEFDGFQLGETVLYVDHDDKWVRQIYS